jgi:DNA repair exonuclease SbcCD ATPase subunit
MITGRDTLQEINDHILQAQSQIENADREMDHLTSRLSELRIEEADQFRQLAKFRLDEMNAGQVAARLEKVHHAVPTFLDQHKQALGELDNKLEQIKQSRQKLEQHRETGINVRDKAIETLQLQLGESKKKLEQDQDYQLQKEKAIRAAEVTRRADQKASQSEADLASKGKPYREDSIFMYLWQRRYMTPDYRANIIIRSLDGWVARLIDYRETRADYHMLNELPLRLREHADRAAEEARRQQEALQALERQTAEKDGVGASQTALEKAEAQLQDINDEIETHEERYQELLAQKADFVAGKDKYTQKAVEVLVAELENEDTLELYRQAQATPRPEDDAIVMRLHKLQQEQQETNKRISELKADRQQHRKALEELTKLGDKFRRSNYDTRFSSFPTNLGIGILLGEILRGGRSSGSAWDRIGKSQKWEFPDIGGSGGSGGGGFGGFGGFGSGGGFGGGGFRTGGGF